MHKAFQERFDRLNKIVQNTNIAQQFPMLVEFKINPANFSILKEVIGLYLSTNLYVNKTNNIEILPNRTPNGVLLPKKETFLEFNLIHKYLSNIVENDMKMSCIENIQSPANIRIIGQTNSHKDSRPYASSKLHSDIWAGDSANIFIVIIPILGDITNTIEFYEPDESFLLYNKKLSDYADAGVLIKNCVKYDCELKFGFGYILDSFLLHKTIKTNTPDYRISIDFRFYSNIFVDTDNLSINKDYIPLSTWLSIGKNNFLMPEETIEECSKRFANANLGTNALINLMKMETQC